MNKKLGNTKRGFTILEVLTVTTMISIVGGMSFVQLQKMKVKQRKGEAKIQLGHLYKNQELYRFKNNKYADGIESIMFPEGTMRYNVGHQNSGTDTDFHKHTRKHNFRELCDIRKCDIQHPNNANFNIPSTGTCGDTSYVAYAVGDIYTNDGSSPATQLDKWKINQDNVLENCQDPTDDDTTDTC